jgi:PII-like signaling protein
MTTPVKMLLIYLDETDLHETGRLYEAIIRRLRQLGVNGATAIAGMMGFGAHLKVHHKRLFGISDDKPVVITVVDSEPVIRRVLPEIRGMVKEGLVVLLDVELVEPLDISSNRAASGESDIELPRR